MKKIGILGGLAWPSTVEYYAGICQLVEQRHANAGLAGKPVMPEMVIESLDLVLAASLFGDDSDETSWLAFDAYHRAALQRLEKSGAEFAVIACNTAHHRFAQITHGITIPVLNIVEVAAEACAWTDVTQVLILGTTPVMRSPVFRKIFAREGIKAVGPRGDRDRRTILHAIDALQRRRTHGASERIREIAAHAAIGRPNESTAVYLGCTELPLAFPAYQRTGMFEYDGIHYVNSTALHIRAAFEYAVSTTAPSALLGSIHRDTQAGLSSARRDNRERDRAQHPRPGAETQDAGDGGSRRAMQVGTFAGDRLTATQPCKS